MFLMLKSKIKKENITYKKKLHIRKIHTRKKLHIRKNTYKKKLQLGGRKFNDLIISLQTNFFPNIFDEIRGVSTETILESLKITINPEKLENTVNQAIDITNQRKIKLLIPNKLPCSWVRELYKTLINGLIDKWIEKCNLIYGSNKAKGLGASYIRWVCRVTSREFTDMSSIASRLVCNKDKLRNRDAEIYDCDVTQTDIPCPSEEYVINRYITNPSKNPIDTSDENNTKWLTLVEAAKRDNENWSFFAELGKGITDDWHGAV